MGAWVFYYAYTKKQVETSSRKKNPHKKYTQNKWGVD